MAGGILDYSKMVAQLGLLANVADDPFSRRDAVNPIMGLEGAGGPRGGGAPRLSVAMKRADGSVVPGKPGQTHGDLYEAAGPRAQSGFVTPEGTYLTRGQAMKWVEIMDPITRSKIPNRWGMESMDYRDALKK
jgi:hypothetical protein